MQRLQGSKTHACAGSPPPQRTPSRPRRSPCFPNAHALRESVTPWRLLSPSAYCLAVTRPAHATALPLSRWHRSLFIAGAALTLLVPLVHAYLLMPFPGSQDLETIQLAYYLEKAQVSLLVLGVVPLALPVAQVVLHGTLGRRILLGLFAVVGIAVAYETAWAFSAEKMFREPITPVYADKDKSGIPLDAVVLGVAHAGEARAYPVDLIGYHHKVLDAVGGRPILVTYCTMCRTGRVYSPVIDGVPQKFRLVGARHYNAVIEDEQTGTWWYQASGRAAVGPRSGRQLEALAHEQTTLRAWTAAHPETTILQPDPAFASDYADLAGYDRRRPPSPEGADPRWSRRSWIVGLVVGDTAKAYPWDDLVSRRAVGDTVGGVPVLLTVEEDSMSFHAFRRDIDGEALTFTAEPGGKAMIDDKTGSRWSLRGECLSGKLAGRTLTPVQAHQEYWHSWKTFHPSTATWTAAL